MADITKKKTFYLCNDRKGVHCFCKKPTYNSSHDFFQGEKIYPGDLPRDRKKYRVIRKFVANVTGNLSEQGYSPEKIRVGAHG